MGRVKNPFASGAEIRRGASDFHSSGSAVLAVAIFNWN
jgi:hypothetical protein